MVGKLLGILLVTLLLASGCSRSDNDHREIIKTLSTRSQALNSRNLAKYFSVVSKRYSDKNKSYEQLKENLEKNFRNYEAISYEPESLSITFDGICAESVGNYRMKIKVREKEIILKGTEHIRLVKEPEGWKIIAGI